MKIRFLLFFLLTIFILPNCDNRVDLHFSENLIKRLSTEDPIFSVYTSDLNLFCKCQNDKVMMISSRYLREWYQNSSTKSDYYSFLKGVLNQKIKINCDNFENAFELDSHIKNQYQEIGIDRFLKSFCKDSGDNIYLLNNNIPRSKKMTVLYFLFINNYVSSEDDYGGYFVIRKM